MIWDSAWARICPLPWLYARLGSPDRAGPGRFFPVLRPLGASRRRLKRVRPGCWPLVTVWLLAAFTHFSAPKGAPHSWMASSWGSST